MYILDDYDNLLKSILAHGHTVMNRTGIPTISLFGVQCKYDISTYVPLLTRRRLNYKSILAELFWVLSGSTNNNDLVELGCDYWTPWVCDKFTDKHGFPQGSFGKVYGHQLRNFGGTLGGFDGFDQLSYVQTLLENNSDSRRILYSLWNPADLDEMRLPPCHMTFQLTVRDNKLHGLLWQRSCDVPVGGPANIFYYSALIYMLAYENELQPGTLTHQIGDAHIYENQVMATRVYLARVKIACPRLTYGLEGFNVINYNPEPSIKFEVTV